MTAAPIRPFTIAVSDAVIDDLHRRLRTTRWPEPELVDDWSQGIAAGLRPRGVRVLGRRVRLACPRGALNRFDQFTTPRSTGSTTGSTSSTSARRIPRPLPLLITHGWPGSIVEFHKVIEPLTNPVAHGGDAADAFHVVARRCPGFGFSGKPTATGWGVRQDRRRLGAADGRLGYDRYVAQGGDWGSAVTTRVGATRTSTTARPSTSPSPMASLARSSMADPTPDGAAGARQRSTYYMDWDSGYSKQQSTRPQTLGYGLADSPVGQAAWILEKFWAWTDCDGHPENALTRDELLDNVMLYWLNGTGASSARLYWESFGRGPRPGRSRCRPGSRCSPRRSCRRCGAGSSDSTPTSGTGPSMPRGGHFAAFEQPELFVDDVRTCFRQFR